MDKPKKHSGAANRNRKREKEAEVAKYSQKIHKFLVSGLYLQRLSLR